MKNSFRLISPEQDIQKSPVYIGFVILKMFKEKDRVSIFDLYRKVKKDIGYVPYNNTIYALCFLYSLNIIYFRSPYVYKISN